MVRIFTRPLHNHWTTHRSACANCCGNLLTALYVRQSGEARCNYWSRVFPVWRKQFQEPFSVLMNTRFNLVPGFIGLTCFVFAAGSPPAHAEDDTNKVKWERIVGIFTPNTLASLATLARRAASHAARPR